MSTDTSTRHGPKVTRTLKILLVGDSGVGKTAFMHRYVNGVFLDDYKMTVGVDFAQKQIVWRSDTEHLRLNLQIWDLAGQDRFASMTRVYYRDAHGAIVLFDLTNARSFEGAAKWKSDIDSKCRLLDGSSVPCLLLANKSDLRLRDVSQERIEQLGNRGGFVGWAETSVKQNIFVEDSVLFLLEHILQRLSLAESADSDWATSDSATENKLKPVKMDNPIIHLDGNNKKMSMSVVDSKESSACC